MNNLNFSELCLLHQETIQRQAAVACILRGCRPSRPSLAARALPALGDVLIRTGQRLKEFPRRLEAESASISSWIITL